MSMQPVRLRSAYARLTLTAFLAGTPVFLAAAPWENLVKNSPFGGAATNAQEQAGAGIEFRGFVQEGDVLFFNVYDLDKKTSRWVAKDDEARGLKVESYDATTQLLVVRDGTRQLQLPLKQATITLARPVAAPGPEMNHNPHPDEPALAPEEKTNLEKVAQEIRRRRELRRQSTNTAKEVRQAPGQP